MNEPVPDPRTIPTEPPSPSEEFGEVFVGRHRLIRKIGSGGMGTVYEAEQEQPRRRVAVKLLNTALTSPAQLVRFADESQHLAGLRHPNIAHVIEAGTQRYGALEVPYFAMEYVEGGRPITTFAEQEQLTTAQRLRLFEQVCAAVHHAHAQHVLHRDLKPANILVDVDGRPKLIDFGIARGLGAGTGAHAQTLTQPSEVVGTPQYMSPEQLAPQRVELDRRSDVYALGLVLYELLCGQPPYDLKGTTHAEAARIVRERPVPRPRRRNPRLSRDLETVILKALRKHRNARYASAAELGEDVRRVLSGEAVGPHGDGTVRRAAAAVRRGVARHAVASGLFVGAAAFLIALALGAWAERFETTAKVECLLTTHVPFAPAGPLEHVRMIALRPGTDVSALAVREGLADVDPDRVQSVRRLHGRLMEKLAGAGARVVAWDFGFNSSNPSFDPDLVRGIRELRESGTAVVLVVPDWRVDGRGRPTLSAAIPEDVPWGSSIVQLYPDITWTVNLAVEYQANHCVPALALSAAAAFWRPFAEASYEFGLWDVEVHYRNPRGSADWRAVPITSIDEWRRPQPGIGLDGDEPVAQFYLQVPSDADLEASTVDYAEVFSASPQQLSAWFAGRAVVIGDARGTREPLRAHPGGRLLPSVVAHAVALDWLIDGRAIRRPHALEVWNFYVGPRFAAELFTAGLACALALALARRPRTLIAALLALCGVVAGASVAAFAGAGILLAPHGAVLVLVLVACCVWSVHRWGRGVELG